MFCPPSLSRAASYAYDFWKACMWVACYACVVACVCRPTLLAPSLTSSPKMVAFLCCHQRCQVGEMSIKIILHSLQVPSSLYTKHKLQVSMIFSSELCKFKNTNFCRVIEILLRGTYLIDKYLCNATGLQNINIKETLLTLGEVLAN